MLIEFMSEMKQIISNRNVKSDDGVVGVIREQNQKWNAVVNLFIKKYGDTPITRDGFKTAMGEELGFINL